jgi:hypothetical protein
VCILHSIPPRVLQHAGKRNSFSSTILRKGGVRRVPNRKSLVIPNRLHNQPSTQTNKLDVRHIQLQSRVSHEEGRMYRHGVFDDERWGMVNELADQCFSLRTNQFLCPFAYIAFNSTRHVVSCCLWNVKGGQSQTARTKKKGMMAARGRMGKKKTLASLHPEKKGRAPRRNFFFFHHPGPRLLGKKEKRATRRFQPWTCFCANQGMVFIAARLCA